MDKTNCPNCGAPMTRDGQCQYCGTVHGRGMCNSGIRITSDSIVLWAENQPMTIEEIKHVYGRDSTGKIHMREV